jgi:hypothetical protein
LDRHSRTVIGVTPRAARDSYVCGRLRLGLSAFRVLALAAGGQVGVGASDQFVGAVLGRERRESDLDLAPIAAAIRS